MNDESTRPTREIHRITDAEVHGPSCPTTAIHADVAVAWILGE